MRKRTAFYNHGSTCLVNQKVGSQAVPAVVID